MITLAENSDPVGETGAVPEQHLVAKLVTLVGQVFVDSECIQHIQRVIVVRFAVRVGHKPIERQICVEHEVTHLK